MSKMKSLAKWELAHALMAAQPSAVELKWLQLIWDGPVEDDGEDSEDSEALSQEEDAGTSCLLLTLLAAHAKGLQSLYLEITTLHAMAPMSNLRHLMLYYLSTSPDLSCLAHMPALQTLFMSSIIIAEQPDLSSLASLCHLREVKLDCVIPSRIALPPGAALHVAVYTDMHAQKPVWHTVLPILRSLLWNKWEEQVFLYKELPQMLKVASGLTEIYLKMRRVGSTQQPLRLSELCAASAKVFISCENAWVDLWGGKMAPPAQSC
jgi:hypothetical protein